MMTVIVVIVVFIGYLPRLMELAELHQIDKAEGLLEDEAKRKRELVQWLWRWMAILFAAFAMDAFFICLMF